MCVLARRPAYSIGNFATAQRGHRRAGGGLDSVWAMAELPHLRSDDSVHMVDVGSKPHTSRRAVAEAFVRLGPETRQRIREADLKKGDALAVARLAGIAGAKKTAELVLLAHPIALTGMEVDLALVDDGVRITTWAATIGPTGVEMEALVAASSAALNLYDMVKGVERGASIEQVRLLEKDGGESGNWRRQSD